MRLLLKAPAPITPYSAWNPDARDILDPELLDSIAKLRGFLKFKFARGLAHCALQIFDQFFAFGGRQIRVALSVSAGTVT